MTVSQTYILLGGLAIGLNGLFELWTLWQFHRKGKKVLSFGYVYRQKIVGIMKGGEAADAYAQHLKDDQWDKQLRQKGFLSLGIPAGIYLIILAIS